MKLVNIIGLSAFQIISCIFVVAYLFGLLNNHFSDKNNYCGMTYMFEYPQFVRISLNDNTNVPQYGLYAYSEGRFTERARKMWFDGIPVLFLPGNSGSHMQARSLASVALRKSLSQGYEYHFDYFTVNFNEELSGLYGGVLQTQTQFAAASISKILSLYKSNRYTKSVPTSVILIGHSMGGIIAKRLLAYPSTINSTNIAITLATPIEAPVINFDSVINDYYMLMNLEWEAYVKGEIKEKKKLISIGSGPRDVLVPAGLTSSNDSHVNVLATAIPGVWITPDHVSMVWCKQLVMVINRFLFEIIDPWTQQVTENNLKITSKAKQYFKANRSMVLDPKAIRSNVTMQADAFWYEDNRRTYQISRPEIDRNTHLMIRLVSFPQNRFVAIEAVNVDNKDWIFGCNAKHIYNNYRHCTQASSLSELSRWTGAATDFGKRKLATVDLHDIMDMEPEWTHVIVKVSPTRKPITLNVDINDHASRQINVNLPSLFSFGKQIIKAETEENSLYYELVLLDFNLIHQAYLLYVEPINCQAPYHASAELHVPWANHDSFHYFTHLKKSPMKLRLLKSNPNVTLGLDAVQHVKVTLLLDPKCLFSISISTSWYHRLAQLSRNYTPILIPYIAAVVLLAARSNLLHFKQHGSCISVHNALMSEGVKPYYALVFGRFATMGLVSVPFLSFLFENASWRNLELQYFTKSLLVLPVYMTALGILNIVATAVLAIMVFSSQLAHRLLFRIVWRGGTGLAEKMAVGLQKVPMLVSAALICAVPLSCGAASMAAGAAFYAFMLSKMYEEYLEDYVYKLTSKVASRLCRVFKSKVDQKPETQTDIQKKESSKQNTNSEIPKAIENKTSSNNIPQTDNKSNSNLLSENETEKNKNKCDLNKSEHIDEDLNNINFHMMMFFLWMIVTLVNVPALLTWARNFKYSMVLKPDTSYHTGLIMSACSTIIWQMSGPKKDLRNYEAVTSLLFTMAVFILALGPFSLAIVNYGVTFMFVVISLHQLYDKEDAKEDMPVQPLKMVNDTNIQENKETKDATSDDDQPKSNINNDEKENLDEKANSDNAEEPSECDVCNESRIYNMFKNLREKFSFSENE